MSGAEMVKDFGEQTKSIFSSAALFIAIFAWRDVIQGIIDRYYPNQRDNFRARIIYALFVTFLAFVLITFVFKRSN